VDFFSIRKRSHESFIIRGALEKQSSAERLALLWIMQMRKVFREIIVVSSTRISIRDDSNYKLRKQKTTADKVVYLMSLL
jgi:hypothetical protein